MVWILPMEPRILTGQRNTVRSSSLCHRLGLLSMAGNVSSTTTRKSKTTTFDQSNPRLPMANGAINVSKMGCEHASIDHKSPLNNVLSDVEDPQGLRVLYDRDVKVGRPILRVQVVVVSCEAQKNA